MATASLRQPDYDIYEHSETAFLLIPAMAGLMRLTPARSGRLTTIGGGLAGIALAGLGADNLMFAVVLGMLTPTHNNLATQVVRIANHAPLAGVPFIPAPLLTIGLILVGIGLLRAGTAPRALAILLLVGAVLVVPSGGGGLITVALLAPMCLSIATLGAILAGVPPPANTHSPQARPSACETHRRPVARGAPTTLAGSARRWACCTYQCQRT